jgi:hypothetical protein
MTEDGGNGSGIEEDCGNSLRTREGDADEEQARLLDEE